MKDETASTRSAMALLQLAMLVLVLIAVLVRATTILDPFPYWDLDAMRSVSIPTSLGPTRVIFLDVLMILASGVCLSCHAVRGHRIRLGAVVLLAVAAIGVGLHSFVLGSGGGAIDNLRIGASWIAAMSAGICCWHVCENDRLMRITLASISGLIALLLAKSLVQVYIEHPMMVKSFIDNQQAFLAARGWAEGSSSALSFERRLMQPEAIGWFGLSNVLASVAAASLVLWVGIALAGLRARMRTGPIVESGWVGVASMGAIFSGATLWLTHSKGGITAAALGLMVLLVFELLDKKRSWNKLHASLAWVGVIATILPIGAILLRGAIGIRIGELSLLFRWFYLEAATNIFAEHPLVGVGPAGFKDAYLLTKNPLSPEEVASPHGLFADYAASLGIFGLLLAGLWVWMLLSAGQAMVKPADISTKSSEAGRKLHDVRTDLLPLLLIAGSVTVFGAWIETESTLLSMAIARIAGLVGWVVLALGLSYVCRLGCRWRIGLLGSVCAFAAHAQIEVTPVWQGAAPLMMVLIGAGAARPMANPSEKQTQSHKIWSGLTPGLLVVLIGLVLGGMGLGQVWRWEARLAKAANVVEPVASITTRLSALGRDQSSLDSIELIAADLGLLLHKPAPRSMSETNEMVRQLVVQRGQLAGEILMHQHVNGGAGWGVEENARTIRAASRIFLTVSEAFRAGGEEMEAANALAQAVESAEFATLHWPDSAANWNWLGLVLSLQKQLSDKSISGQEVIEAFEQAALLDPYGLDSAHRVLLAVEQWGDHEQIVNWAGRVLRLNEQARLDPLRQMTDKERLRVQRLAQSP